MDNFIFNSNDFFELKNIYRASFEEMKEGGFYSAIGAPTISLLIKNEGIFIEYGCDKEGILGYKFNFSKDCLYNSKSNVNPNINTKRDLLSESKIFDPFNFTLTVHLQSKIILRLVCLLDKKLVGMTLFLMT